MKSVILGILLISFCSIGQANDFHNIISYKSSAAKKTFFKDFLHKSGQSCVRVTRTFYQGMGHDGEVYWNVKCSNGKSYSIQIMDDADGSTRITDCGILKLIGLECFKKF